MRTIKKKILTISFTAILLSSLFLFSSFQGASAYLYNSTSGQIWFGDTLAGKYGCTVAYDATGGSENDRVFFPTMEVKAVNSWVILGMGITVSGTKPNGESISGSELVPTAQLISPYSGHSDEWYGALTTVFGLIRLADPTGLSDFVKLGYGVAPGPDYIQGFSITAGTDATSAYTNYDLIAYWTEKYERGYQFRVTLHCDPSLGGTYTLNVHYSIFLSIPDIEGTDIHKDDIYQTITYEFTPPHIYGDVGGGVLSAPVEFFGDANNIIGYAANGYYAGIGCYPGGAGYVSGMLDSEQTGQNDIYLYGYTTASGAYVYTYVSETNGNWQWVGSTYISPNGPNTPHLIATATQNFRYVLICNYNPTSYPMGLVIDCVTTT